MTVFVLLMCLNAHHFADEGECCEFRGLFREMVSAQRAALDICQGELQCVRRSQIRAEKVKP